MGFTLSFLQQQLQSLSTEPTLASSERGEEAGYIDAPQPLFTYAEAENVFFLSHSTVNHLDLGNTWVQAAVKEGGIRLL